MQLVRVHFINSLRQRVSTLEQQIHQLNSRDCQLGVYYAEAKQVCEKEFASQFHSGARLNERVVEYAHALMLISQIDAATVLDVGAGYSPWPALLRACGYIVTATDSMDGYWGSKIFNRHFHVVEDDITHSKLAGKYDLVTCLSTLEHILDYHAAIENMKGLINPGGYLILSFPYNEHAYEANNYRRPRSRYGKETRYICQSFSRANLNDWLDDWGTVVGQRYFKAFTGDFWSVGDKIAPPVEVGPQESHQLTVVCFKRNEDELAKPAPEGANLGEEV